MPPLRKDPLKASLKALKPTAPTPYRGASGGWFVADDPRPYCDRCKLRPSEVIVGASLAAGTYLCRHCWGRVPAREL